MHIMQAMLLVILLSGLLLLASRRIDQTYSELRGFIITFQPINGGPETSSIAYSMLGSAKISPIYLTPGRYIIYPPSGYTLVGDNRIYLSKKHTCNISIITLTNGNSNLYIRIA